MTLFNERFLAGMDACLLDATNYMTFLMQNCVVTRPSERKKASGKARSAVLGPVASMCSITPWLPSVAGFFLYALLV